MMRDHKISKKIPIAIGLLLGITATGVGAKANVNQSTNTTDNGQQANHINQNSNQNNKTTLINQQSNANNKINNLGQRSQSQTNINQNNSSTQNYPKQFNKDISKQTDQLHRHIISHGISKNIHKSSDPEMYQVGAKQYSINAEGAHNTNSNCRGIIIHHKNKVRDINHSNHHKTYHKINYIHKHNHQSATYQKIHHYDWFKDGLSYRNLKARDWVSMHESSHRWNVLSYGHVCIGYFQLNPRYLGYRHGHIDLRPRHQVKVADRYVSKRYGDWVNAKHFWESHHWY